MVEMAVFVKLISAAFFSSCLGAERYMSGRPDGFKTYILVGLGSCLFVVSSTAFYHQYGNFSGIGAVGVDPGRVAAQVVTGVGFLGAGAIMRDAGTVRGLTSAACLWVVAAIGISCGIGMYDIAGFVTLISVGTLVVLKKIENVLRKDVYRVISFRRTSTDCQDVEDLFYNHAIKIIHKSVEIDKRANTTHYEYRLRHHNTNNMLCDVVKKISNLRDMESARLH